MLPDACAFFHVALIGGFLAASGCIILTILFALDIECRKLGGEFIFGSLLGLLGLLLLLHRRQIEPSLGRSGICTICLFTVLCLGLLALLLLHAFEHAGHIIHGTFAILVLTVVAPVISGIGTCPPTRLVHDRLLA